LGDYVSANIVVMHLAAQPEGEADGWIEVRPADAAQRGDGDEAACGR
jgi:hypothetical protein